jgi:hypothetical protein
VLLDGLGRPGVGALPVLRSLQLKAGVNIIICVNFLILFFKKKTFELLYC